MNNGKKILPNSPIIICLLLLIFQPLPINAVNSIDSLQQELESLHGSGKIQVLIDLAREYHYINLNKSRFYAKQALKLCERYDDRKNLAVALKYIALSYHVQEQLDSAFYYYNRAVLYELEKEEYAQVADSYNNIGLINIAWHYPILAINSLEEALEYTKKTGVKKNIARAHNNLGVAYKRTEQFEKALEHLTKSLSIYNEENDLKGIAATNNNIGTILLKIQSYKKAIEKFQNAIDKYKEIGDKNGVAKSMNNLGNVYENMGDYKRAQKYYEKSLLTKKEIGDHEGISISYNNLGHLHKTRKDYPKALEYFNRSLKIKENISDTKGITTTFNNLASLYIEMGKPRNAMSYLDSCIQISKENNYRENLREAYKNYSEAYEAAGNYKRTLYYKELYYKLRDSELVENSEKLTDILVNFQMDKKNREIELLQKDYRIQKLELEKKDIKFQTLLIIILIVLITGVLISYLFYKRYKEKKQHEEQLITKNNQLNKILEDLKSEIKKRRIAEEGLIKAKEDITLAYEKQKELNELKSRFVSMISHEYRNPLTVILSSAEILPMITDPKQREENIHKIKSQVKVMVDLLEDVLMVGRIETNRVNLNEQDINIIEFSESISEEVIVAYKNSHKIKIKTDLNDPEIYTDPKLLRYILTNLLSNAIKYSPDSKAVVLSLEDFNNKLSIKVTDYGIGILPQDQKYIFDPFFRGKNVEKIPGTGYGLSILKGCVETLKGNIKLDSTPGKGSTFEVIIPKE
mgnify:FL=1